MPPPGPDDPPRDAAQGPAGPPAQELAPVRIRPKRIRQVCWVLAPVIFATFVLLGAGLTGSMGASGGVFRRSDQVAMGALGLLLAAGILLFTRPKVVADTHRIKIQNVIGGYDLPWEVVRAIRFERGHPWLTLELQDDELVAVMAVQAADKEHAVAGARALRALLLTHRGEPPRPPMRRGPG